jgi:mitogen-activated protein kinase 1/3
MSAPRNITELQAEVDKLDPRYRLEKVIGNGSYGMVIRAKDTTDNCLVAVKRINSEIFGEAILAMRILREIRLLAHFHDDNIVGMRNILTPPSEDFTEFYLVMDMMETDLKQVFKSSQKLTDAHIQFFLYQALRALKVIHTAGVIHRDITPANILVNTNCDLKICDFGLAKEECDDGEQTDYVTMRWYRAPELVMEHRHYDGQVDVWGIGCILGELLGSKPMFPGKDRVNQLDKIIDVTGTPTDEEISSLGSLAAQKYVKKKSGRAPMNLPEKFPHANPQAVDLLGRLLKFHPAARVTVDAALAHPYLAELRDESDDNMSIPVFTFNEGDYKTIRDIKRAIVQESISFHRRFPKTKPPKGFGCQVAVDASEGRTGDSNLSSRELESKEAKFL